MYAHVGVAFVGANYEATRFGNGEIDAGEGHFPGQKRFTQVLPGGFGEVLRVGSSRRGAEVFVEGIAHVRLFEVDGGQHNMRRFFAPHLHNPFAQITVDHLDTVLDQVFVQVTFFGQHRLRFDHLCGISRL